MYQLTPLDRALMDVIHAAEAALRPLRLTLGIEREFTFERDPYMRPEQVWSRVAEESRALTAPGIDPDKRERHRQLLRDVQAKPHRLHARFWDVYRMQVETPELEAADRKTHMTEPAYMLLGGDEDGSPQVNPTYEVQWRGGRESRFTWTELIDAYLAFPDAVQRRTGQRPDYATTNFHLHLGVSDKRGVAVEPLTENALRRLYGSLVEDALPLLMHAGEVKTPQTAHLVFDHQEAVTACEIQEQGTDNCHLQLRKTFTGDDAACGYGFHPLIASLAMMATAFRAAHEERGLEGSERGIPDACFRQQAGRERLPAIPLSHSFAHYPASPAAARLGRMLANPLLRADWGDTLLSDMVQSMSRTLGVPMADIQLAEHCRQEGACPPVPTVRMDG